MPPTSAAGTATNGEASRSGTPTMTAPRTPIRNWPWAPMLNRPALKPKATDRPPSTSGVVTTSELTIAFQLPSEPWSSAAYAVSGSQVSNVPPGVSSSRQLDDHGADDERQHDGHERHGQR